MKSNSRGCSAAIGSLTQAMKAQKALGEAAIPTTVIKYDSSRAGSKGCIYGIDFSCAQTKNVQTVLSRERIKVKQWNVES